MKLLNIIATHPSSAGLIITLKSSAKQQETPGMILLSRSMVAGLGATSDDTLTVWTWVVLPDQAACDEWEAFSRELETSAGGTVEQVTVSDYVPGGTWSSPAYTATV
jgi:hypothetical protein